MVSFIGGTPSYAGADTRSEHPRKISIPNGQITFKNL
jgi:hypothetical protein